jgi:hypothetical protein
MLPFPIREEFGRELPAFFILNLAWLLAFVDESAPPGPLPLAVNNEAADDAPPEVFAAKAGPTITDRLGFTWTVVHHHRLKIHNS